jgi:hypothetical protein
MDTYLGIDVGSVTTKLVALDENYRVLDGLYLRTRGKPLQVVQEGLREISARLPEDVEIIFMDDGSKPPLSCNGVDLKNFCIYPTNDFRPWTQPIARNTGAKIAKGEYLLCTDIDFIISRDLALDKPT